MQLTKLFKEDEPSVSRELGSLCKLLEDETGLLRGFGRVLQHYDEPKPWQYVATINSDLIKQEGDKFKTVTSGISFFSEKHAILKCLAETVERYCNFAFFLKDVDFVGSYKNLKVDAINPIGTPYFSGKQLAEDKFKEYVITTESIFSWSNATSLVSGQRIMVPSQMIYLSYPHIPGEPFIYPGISTGTAGGGCLSAAIVRGICEVVERDAFMIFYLNKLGATKIKLDKISDKRVQKIVKIMRRYKLNIFSFDITTDIPVPTFLTILIDKTGTGKAVSTGLKSGLNPIDALIGSMEEIFNTRTWLRNAHEDGDERRNSGVNNPDVEYRGFLWYEKDAIKRLDFLLQSPNSKNISNNNRDHKKSGDQLKYLVNIFKSVGYNVIYKDITLPQFKNMNYFVSKVIIPQMQPFFLNEDRRLLGGSRLYEVPEKLGFIKKNEEELNKFPHPFI